MIRRWKLGLVLTLIIAIVASGRFASTASVDVPPSNAGIATVQVQIAAPQPLCDEDVESETQSAGTDGGESTIGDVCEQDDASDSILAPFLENLPE